MRASIAALALVLVSCGREPPADADARLLMAALGQAKAYHHLADVHLAEGQPDEAAAAVERILAIRFPAGADGEDALLDARARLAKLQLGQGRLDDARQVVDEGLRATARDSFFLANLYSVSGELHEARGRAVDAAAAAGERRAAIADYGRSLEINERIQKQLDETAP